MATRETALAVFSRIFQTRKHMTDTLKALDLQVRREAIRTDMDVRPIHWKAAAGRLSKKGA